MPQSITAPQSVALPVELLTAELGEQVIVVVVEDASDNVAAEIAKCDAALGRKE